MSTWGAADVEGGLQFYYRKGKELLGLDVGGRVVESGQVIIHHEEEVDPARVIKGGETVLERMTKAINGMMGQPQAPQSQPPINYNFYAPLI